MTAKKEGFSVWGKWQLAGASVALGAALISQSAVATSAVAAEGGTAKKGEYCTPWKGYESGNGMVTGRVRSCFAWFNDSWHAVTHVNAQQSMVVQFGVRFVKANPGDPATWKVKGVAWFNSKESMPYSYGKKTTTWYGGESAPIKQGVKCGIRKMTRTYEQHGPVYRDAGGVTINSGEETFNITVPCA